MEIEVAIDEWDFLILALVKACVGNTTPNFSCVIIDRKDRKWLIRFWLFSESEDDRDVIREISTEFYSYGEDYEVFTSLDDIASEEVNIGVMPVVGYDPRATTVFAINRSD
jgi:hypothetical protein